MIRRRQEDIPDYQLVIELGSGCWLQRQASVYVSSKMQVDFPLFPQRTEIGTGHNRKKKRRTAIGPRTVVVGWRNECEEKNQQTNMMLQGKL